MNDMEYPFGFGFELMNNPEAMAYLDSLEDTDKKKLMKRMGQLKTAEELREFIRKLPRTAIDK